MTDPIDPTTPVQSATSDKPPRDAQAFLQVAFFCVILLGTLWGVARAAPSARQLESVSLPTPIVAADAGCATFARYWMEESGADVSAAAISAVSNCYRTMDGSWFVPVGSADRRLGATFQLDELERQRTQGVRDRIRRDIVALDRLFPSGLRQQLQRNYDVRNLPVTGHTKWGADRRSLGPTQGRYLRLTQAFLMSPERIWLADYVGWQMGRRIGGASELEGACRANPDLRLLERACTGLREDLGLEAIPFVWQLNDPVMLAQYLDELAASGRDLPMAEPEATPVDRDAPIGLATPLPRASLAP